MSRGVVFSYSFSIYCAAYHGIWCSVYSSKWNNVLCISFNLIYDTPISGKYFLLCFILEKCGKIWKNNRFSGRLRLDWGDTTRAATAGLGSIGLIQAIYERIQTVPWLMVIKSFSRAAGMGTFVNAKGGKQAEIGQLNVLCTYYEGCITYRMYQTYQLVRI